MKLCKIKNCKNKYSAKGYCCFHWQRKFYSDIPINLPYHGNKGYRNINWRGGIAEYPNHYLMKKNRLIILFHNPICEICHKKPAIEIHHKNGDKSDHRLSNLAASCHRCNSAIRFRPNKVCNTKFIRLYGLSFKQIAQKINYNQYTIYKWHYKGILNSIIISNPKIFSLDKIGVSVL